MAGFRVGFGYDSHLFEAGRRLVLCGIEILRGTDPIGGVESGGVARLRQAISTRWFCEKQG